MVYQCWPRRLLGSSSSHHLHALPGLLIVIREMTKFGWDYVLQTIALGQALTDEEMNVAAKEFGFTENHQLAINITNFGAAKDIARSLSDKNNVITNFNMLPLDRNTKTHPN